MSSLWPMHGELSVTFMWAHRGSCELKFFTGHNKGEVNGKKCENSLILEWIFHHPARYLGSHITILYCFIALAVFLFWYCFPTPHSINWTLVTIKLWLTIPGLVSLVVACWTWKQMDPRFNSRHWPGYSWAYVEQLFHPVPYVFFTSLLSWFPHLIKSKSPPLYFQNCFFGISWNFQC